MLDKEHFDGLSWEDMKRNFDTDPNAPGYWDFIKEDAVHFRMGGCRLTLYRDRTWSIDSAPDWNGAS